MTKLTTRIVDFVPARPNGLLKLFWRQYFLWSIKRHFHTCYVTGEEYVHCTGEDSATLPTIFACTHGSWWDAALTIELSLGQYKLDAYGMMEYKQLRKYSFFSRIGMFSVIREDAASALQSLRYGADLIRGSHASLWMFPQGTLVHQDAETIACEPGIGILASLVGRCRIVPVALRYEQLREQRPSCWVRFGAPYLPERSHGVRLITQIITERLTDVRDTLRADAMAEDGSAYRTFLSGSMSMEKRFDKLMRR